MRAEISDLHTVSGLLRKVTAVIPHPSFPIRPYAGRIGKSTFPQGKAYFGITIACRVVSWSWKIPPKRKMSSFPCGNKDRKYDFCGTTLFAGKLRPLCPVPTHRLPVNAGIASEDTLASAISPCPRRPICCSAFRAPLSYGALSVDALTALLPRPWFILCYDCYTPFVSACQARNCIAGGQTVGDGLPVPKEKGRVTRPLHQYSLTTALTMPMISA